MATTLDVACRTKEGESQTQEPAGQPQHGGEYPLLRRQAMPQ